MPDYGSHHSRMPDYGGRELAEYVAKTAQIKEKRLHPSRLGQRQQLMLSTTRYSAPTGTCSSSSRSPARVHFDGVIRQLSEQFMGEYERFLLVLGCPIASNEQIGEHELGEHDQIMHKCLRYGRVQAEAAHHA